MPKFNELTTPMDRVSKLLFKEYADVLLKLAFPGQAVRLVSVEENVEINLPTRPVDMVMIVADEISGAKMGLHIEYYHQYAAHIPQTLFIYSAELTDRMKMPVATLVIYSERRRPEKRPANEYIVRIGDQIINRFTYPAIWLMDYEAQIRSGELAPLAPFLMEIAADITIETAQAAKYLALQEANEEKRGLLLSLVAILAARHLDKETIRKLFLKEANMIRTNTFIDDWLEESMQKGLQEGLQEGLQASLLRALAHRFGAVPPHLEQRIQELEGTQLERLFDLALDAAALDEIDEALNSNF